MTSRGVDKEEDKRSSNDAIVPRFAVDVSFTGFLEINIAIISIEEYYSPSVYQVVVTIVSRKLVVHIVLYCPKFLD